MFFKRLENIVHVAEGRENALRTYHYE